MSYESSILALDNEFLGDGCMKNSLNSFDIYPLNFVIDSGMLLNKKISNSKGESEILLIDGDLTVSF